jgi:hypothetical protein
MDQGQTAYLGKIAGIYGEVAKFQCCLKESDISANDNSLLEKGTHKTFHRSLSLLKKDTVFAPLR